jgi:alkylation response protein AidB-like acyl-CoA dehydrogenase
MNAQVKSGSATKYESDLTSEIGRRIRDEVRALVPLMRKNALEGERAGRVPDETLKALQATGLFLMSVPIEHGGYALGARDLAEIIIEVARGDASTGWISMIASGHTRIALTLPDKAVGEIYANAGQWLGPTMAGASLFSEKIQKAEKVPGGVIVKSGGKWMFASGCKHAAYSAVGIDFVDDEGNRQRGMALLESSQYNIVDDWHVMGMRASSSNSLTTSADVFVPEYRFLDLAEFPKRLGSFCTRFKGLGYQLDALGVMLIPALEIMGIVVGAAKAGYELFIEQAKSKKPFNLPYATLSESAATQITAAKIGSMIRAGENLLLAQADFIDRKAMAREAFTQFEESRVTMDLVFAGNMCGDALDLIQKAIGSSTISDYSPIQRLVRDARVAITHGSLRLDPVAEIHGRQVFGLEPFTPFGGLPGVKEKSK